MKKRIVWDHVDGDKDLGNHVTETETFFRKYDTNPFTKEKTEMIGFHKIGETRKTWLPLGYNVTEIRVFNDETGELIEAFEIKKD